MDGSSERRRTGAVYLATLICLSVLAGLSAAPAWAQWRIEPIPSSRELTSVTCSSNIFCLAVGGAALSRWDGAQWTTQPTSLRGDFTSYGSVSCLSPSDCIAVGTSGFGEAARAIAGTWDGHELSSVGVPKANAHSSLLGVSCVSSSFCIAVGFSGAGPGGGTLIERWNGRVWQRQRVPLAYYPPPPSGEVTHRLTSVSCVSVRSCVAVGDQGLLVLRWNGIAWKVQPVPSPRWASGLNGISCAAANACMAVGDTTGGVHTPGGVLAERWNGTRWRLVHAPSVPNGELYGVSCPTTSVCVAVGFARAGRGYRPILERWDGTGWHMEAVPTGISMLQSITCASPTFCVAIGSGRAQVIETDSGLVGK